MQYTYFPPSNADGSAVSTGEGSAIGVSWRDKGLYEGKERKHRMRSCRALDSVTVSSTSPPTFRRTIPMPETVARTKRVLLVALACLAVAERAPAQSTTPE